MIEKSDVAPTAKVFRKLALDLENGRERTFLLMILNDQKDNEEPSCETYIGLHCGACAMNLQGLMRGIHNEIPAIVQRQGI